MKHSVTRFVRSALPATILLWVLGGIPPTPQASRAPAVLQAPEPRVIEVLAKRYTFEPSEIEVVEGERVRLLVRSGDGPHGFEIKRFKVSKEIPRGADPVSVEFTATEVGRFPILCSVYCGDGHDDMKGVLIVAARPPAQQ